MRCIKNGYSLSYRLNDCKKKLSENLIQTIRIELHKMLWDCWNEFYLIEDFEYLSFLINAHLYQSKCIVYNQTVACIYIRQVVAYNAVI